MPATLPSPFPTRLIGPSRLKVSALGLGCMGMSDFYGTRDDAESFATLDQALDHGITFLDTADMYGFGDNEQLIGRAIKGRRSQVVLATKFGIVRDRTDQSVRGICGRPEYVKSACAASLRRLGTDHIDLYYQHRVDEAVPIEETVGAMAELVREGKVRHLGLSEVSAATLSRAAAVHPIAAVQSEYSLWSREPEAEVLPRCRALGVSLVAYSPLGRGFLTGRITQASDLPPGDYRRSTPRFQEENLQQNLALLQTITSLATAKHCTAAQLALAWVLAQGPDIVPIPGTKRRRYLDENLAAVTVTLTDSEIQQLSMALPVGAAHGERYPASMQSALNR